MRRGLTLDTGALIALEAGRLAMRKMRSVHVEVLEKHVAMAAGIALGLVSRSTTIDALVMASAALRGDTVYTSDVGDLERLRAGVHGFGHVQIAQA